MLKLFKRMKPYRWYVLIVVVLVFLQCLSDLYLPNLNADIINDGVAKGDTDYILRTGGLMLLITLGSIACAITASYFSSKSSMGFGMLLKRDVFKKVTYMSQENMDAVGAPSLIIRTTNDITQVQNAVMMIMRMMISAPIMMVGSIIMALNTDAGLSWVLVVILPIIAVIFAVMMLKGMPLFKSVQKKIDAINRVMREKLGGIRVIRAFNRTDYESGRFDEANKDLTSVQLRVAKMIAILMPAMMLLFNLVAIFIIWVGGHRIGNGQTDLGSLTAFLQYAMQLLFSVIMASMMFVMLPRASASAERINEALALTNNVADKAGANPKPMGRALLRFSDVSFSYPGADEPVLVDISFETGPGQTTALLGSTGSGKSTLINLIPRLYDVTGGSITLDGVDLRDYTQHELRARIGFVPQKALLFSGTIEDNVRFGNEGATPEQIERALTVAQAMDFVRDKPEGLQSQVSQGGGNLSGGQKQRLSIARAIVRRPEIYIFDDSFSALDFKTDAALRAALRDETRDAAVLIVAQRVTSVMDADSIIVLDEGRIVGRGTHTQLMENCEVYREIVASQLSKEEIA